MPTVVPTRPRGSYAKSAAIRIKVLDACVEAFAKTGFYGATMKDIAARAGISYNGLLHHFPNKEVLLIALLEHRDARSTHVFEEADARIANTPNHSIRAMLDVAVDNELEPGLIELHATLSAEATSPGHPAHEYFRRRYQGLRNFYESAFQTIADRGELTTTLQPKALAAMFIALMDGLQVQWLYAQDSLHIAAPLREFLDSVIATDPPR
ncbi:TetR/AcrR family transcriptional regulator [Microbacterium sp. PRC9]|uniref:TetR/AcrR family transcriptional regulator n=1 Tax=Microbacterium sp. PRC9 TaxID=2962591 RepID=UPI002881BCAB|nr:TetR/AcrR family transcriptional regulator [Microbacterium sp. PRC9]MDT0144543.1 TetR/AcrR family transcriptional regulator [Microbacterium sp. PRC9]